MNRLIATVFTSIVLIAAWLAIPHGADASLPIQHDGGGQALPGIIAATKLPRGTPRTPTPVPSPTPTPEPVSVPGSTDGIVAMSLVIAAVVLIPLLVQRNFWAK